MKKYLMGGRSINIFVSFLILSADRLTKLWALKYSPWLYFNKGVSFSLFESSGLLLSLSGFLLLAILYSKFGEVCGFYLMLAGSVGNLIDRLTYGYVIDWLFVGIYINLADIFICTGALICLQNIYKDREERGS